MPITPADILEITLQRTGTDGPAPAYVVSFRRDGTALYEGQHHVRRLGRWEGRIRVTTLDRLAELAVRNGFFDLLPLYSRSFTCCPWAITTVATERARRTVRNYARAGPPPLVALERAVDALSRRVRWRPATFARDDIIPRLERWD